MRMNWLARLFQPSQQTIAKQLRKPSGRFAKRVGEAMNRSNTVLYDFVLPLLKLRAGEHVLEIGFGNGKLFPKVFAQADNLSVTGLDYSSDMVKQAGRNNVSLLRTRRLRLVQGASNRMPFNDNSFDKAFCINVLYFWDQPLEHLSEVLRVLNPGGAFHAVIRSEESMKTMPFTQYGFQIKPAREWEQLFVQAGFTAVEVTPFSEPPLEVEGRTLHLVSLCVSGRKEKGV